MKFLLLFTNFLSVALLVVASQLSNLIIDPPREYPNHIHRTLFLDREFSEEEAETITIAALEWTEATNYVLDLSIVKLPNQNELIGKDDILITSVSPDSPDIMVSEFKSGHVLLGLYSRKDELDSIQLVSSRITEKQYKAVVLHELGHAFGMDHIEGLDGIDTLMCPFIEFGSGHITHTDLVNFCKLYHCDASKLKN